MKIELEPQRFRKITIVLENQGDANEFARILKLASRQVSIPSTLQDEKDAEMLTRWITILENGNTCA